MIDVSIQDAINAFVLLRDSVNENGFLYECYNLGISALKTIQDGNYILESEYVSRETLTKLANYDCCDKNCTDCELYGGENLWCISNRAKELLKREEIEAWIITHYQN